MSNDLDLPPSPLPLPQALKADAQFSATLADTPDRICPNCGAPAHGPYCYACGQSEKGMIRHLSEVMSEFADIVFNVDSRIFRSLWDLYVRPGYLTVEYLAGRRARYITPFRLFFFMSIAAFFSMQMVLSNDIHVPGLDNIGNASTPDEVKKTVNEQIARANMAVTTSGNSPEKQTPNEESERKIRQRGADRLQQLKTQVDAAIKDWDASRQIPPGRQEASPKAQPNADKDSSPEAGVSADTNEADANDSGFSIKLSDEHWSSENPVHIAWLPDSLNAKLTRLLVHMQENAESVKTNPGRLLAGFFSVLPQTLFILMPLFAVLLKVFYLFKRRLYMEHLLVALHSHAFILLSILIIIGLGLLGSLSGQRAWLTQPLGWLSAMAWIWLFVYLLLMQKRVYGQGWIMTILKFGMVGFSYTFILSIALAFAIVVSLAVI